MSRTVRERQTARRHAQRGRVRLAQARRRRGVLMLVVLSLLVLFLLIGTSFVIITSSYSTSSRVVEQSHETSLQAGDRLDRALLQLLRDTNNPYSSIRYHSLLRDVYGADGFVGHVYAGPLDTLGLDGRSTEGFRFTPSNPNDFAPSPVDLSTRGAFAGPPSSLSGSLDYGDYVSRYAGATDPNNPLGPTNGQLIDIYIQDDLGLMNPGAQGTLGANLSMIAGEAGVGLRTEYVVDLELNAQGLTTNHTLSRTPGYYTGCLLTMLEGPAKGQTTRVVQYDYQQFSPVNGNDVNVARFRVLAFTRSDGTPLVLGLNPRRGDANDLVYAEDTANPIGTINDNDPFYGRRFMVNGRPHNGSGVGLNPVAGVAGPKLGAMERLDLPSGQSIGMEVALAPHARYFVPASVSTFNAVAATDYTDRNYATPRAAFYGNVVDSNLQPFPPIQIAGGRYDSFPGTGGSDESYDAADYQNMFLALQSQQPRPEGRVAAPVLPAPVSPTSPQCQALLQNAGTAGVRLIMDDVPIPSFHRPALVNYWFHRLLQAPWLKTLVSDDTARARAIIDPVNSGLPEAVIGQIVAIKRKVMLRPLREDHPNFDGGNPASRYEGRVSPTVPFLVDVNPRGPNADPADPLDDQIVFPYWEATGPWDVDNDNDGVPDSIWVDLGDPVQKTRDGRLYKPLYAILVQDLDSRLNLNAHGGRDHLASSDLDLMQQWSGGSMSPIDNFAGGANLATGASVLLGISGSQLFSSNQLPHGSGWGPGDVSLRPVLSPDWATLAPGLVGNPAVDDYARLLYGREPLDPVGGMAPSTRGVIAWGRYGNRAQARALAYDPSIEPGPGVNYLNANLPGTTDQLASFKLYDVPPYDPQSLNLFGGPLRQTVGDVNLLAAGAGQPSGYQTSPDLLSRYAAPGLGYSGQPITESARDAEVRALVADSPYELRLDDVYRRDQPAAFTAVTQNDDAPFSLAEFERLLRPFDRDSSRLPSRLWDLVDAFDADKLAAQQLAASRITGGADALTAHQNPNFAPNPVQFVTAQLEATARRRAVTTDSNELQSAAVNWNARMVYGADGRPGVAAVEDNPDGTAWDGTTANISALDDPTEYNRYVDGSNNVAPIDINNNGVLDNGAEVTAAADAFDRRGVDDHLVIMGAAPKPNARLTDYLRYRVTLELKRLYLRQVDRLDNPIGIPPAIMPDADRALVAAGAYPFTAAQLDAAERMIELVINGQPVAGSGEARVYQSVADPNFGVGVAKLASFGGLLAPEVMAGLKMDLNRPFGDGRDNNNNGVVDEPAEAGEPWIDTNGDGVWQSDEPFDDVDGDGRFYANANGDNVTNAADFRDFDGDGVFEPIVDSLFGRQTRLRTGTPAPVPFAHTMGVDASGSGRVIANAVAHNAVNLPVINDDGRLARQLYARHLYCLMLLLSDENYLAPFDADDPQVRHYIDPDSVTSAGQNPGRAGFTPLEGDMGMAARIKQDLMLANPALTDDAASAEARRIALRKLTCRQIAQWAINCADMRDPDAICTPFEYDENPWDGWNVVETVRMDTSGATPQVADPLEQAGVYPIDGDARTSENDQFTRFFNDPSAWPAPARWETDDNPGQIAEDRRPAYFEQTCGIVYGAERPELLITEGLAMHDRRVEDLEVEGDREPNAPAPPANPLNPNANASTAARVNAGDADLDQRLRPRGSVFIELHNPWSSVGPKPAELYSNATTAPRVADLGKDSADVNDLNFDGVPDTLDGNDLPVEGVMLDRLSVSLGTFTDAAGNTYRAPSPVWRMICIEEHPRVRNDDPIDNPLWQGISAYPTAQAPGDRPAPAGALGAGNDGYIANPCGILSPALSQAFVVPPFQTAAGAQRRSELPPTWYRGGTGTTLNSWKRDNAAPRALRVPDPDFPTFDPYTSPRVYLAKIAGSIGRAVYQKPEQYVEREWYFTRGVDPDAGAAEPRPRLPTDRLGQLDPSDVRLCVPVRPTTVNLSPPGSPPTEEVNLVLDEVQGIEREDLWPDMLRLAPIPGAASSGILNIYPWRFPPVVREEFGAGGQDVFRPLRPAPILPGRYAVIGSAGTLYRGAGPLADYEGRYITKISRKQTGGATDNSPLKNSDGVGLQTELSDYRRIELVPNTNPFLHQVAINRNGGDECRVLRAFDPNGDTPLRFPRDRGVALPFLSDDYYVFNVTDPSSFPTDPNEPKTSRVANDLRAFNERPASDDGVKLPPFYTNAAAFDASFQLDPSSPAELRYYAIKPAVALPIEGMNISEPLDSYWLRKWDLESRGALILQWDPDGESGEGAYVANAGGDQAEDFAYDRPFDLAPELCVNHTTPNYRSVHLQRLANPLLAWNPPPLRPNGEPHPQHDATRPVNPYRTVDSLSLDITAFNSINRDESNEFSGSGVPGVGSETRTDFLAKLLDLGLAARAPTGEDREDPADPATLHKRRHFLPPTFLTATGEGDSTQALMTLASNFKGFHEQTLEYGDEPENVGDPIPVIQTLEPGRGLWGQERPNQMLDIVDNRIDLFDFLPQDPVNNPEGALPIHPDLASQGGDDGLAMNFPIRHSLGYDNFAATRAVIRKPEQTNNGQPTAVPGAEKEFYQAYVALRGVFSSHYESTPDLVDADRSPYLIDLDGDGVLGDLVGAPRIDVSTDSAFEFDNPRTEGVDETGQPDYRDDVTTPWLAWNNRPYVSAMELLLTPASSPSRLLADFSFMNPFVADPPNRYDGVAAIQSNNPSLAGGVDDEGAEETNAARIGATRYPYGHLLNFFQSAGEPAVTIPVGDQPIPLGAPNFHRLFDYVHTPSRFVGTEVLLEPQVFNAANPLITATELRPLPAPFNRVSKGREPGKVNLNTVTGRRRSVQAGDVWSDTYDGLMHRVRDTSLVLGNQLVSTGHFGPAWRDVLLSRRGYSIKANGELSPSQQQRYSSFDLHRDYPTRFANPFRNATDADLVPLEQLQQLGADATMLRSHPFTPGPDGVWGNRFDVGDDGTPYTNDDIPADDATFDTRAANPGLDQDLIDNNTLEAGFGDDRLLYSGSSTVAVAPASRDQLGLTEGIDGLIQPLFSEGSTEPALDAGRNAGLAYGPMTRLGNLTTTRSGNFAVWITVGFFEVSNAPDWNAAGEEGQRLRDRFGNSRDLYDRVYPDGYQLGRELGSDTGSTKRFRGFWLIDRTQPVAFKPGENINTERAIRLRRRID